MRGERPNLVDAPWLCRNSTHVLAKHPRLAEVKQSLVETNPNLAEHCPTLTELTQS